MRANLKVKIYLPIWRWILIAVELSRYSSSGNMSQVEYNLVTIFKNAMHLESHQNESCLKFTILSTTPIVLEHISKLALKKLSTYTWL